MKRILLIVLLLNCCIRVSGQEQLSKKQLADKLFEREEYAKAARLYLGLTDKNNPDIRVVERLADCYRLMNDSRSAEQWYSSALSYEKAADIDVYYYAEALLRNNKLKEARKQYQDYFLRVNDPERLRSKLATCDSAAKWMADPRSYTIKAEKKFNSSYSDWGATYYSDNNIVFTSDRVLGDENAKQTYNRTGNGYLKLYQLRHDSVLLLPVSTDAGKLFNGDYHAGPAVFNRTLDTAWITITTSAPKGVLPVDKRGQGISQRLYTRRLQLIMATKKDGVWGNFKEFAYNNIRLYSVGHAALSHDGNILYFASDMPGGEGGTDIWYCQKQADDSWGKPINCGQKINTKNDEAFPTQGPGNVLYFASNGLPGMGGFDVFGAKGSGSMWDAPANLKFPVNSTADDFYFVTNDGLTGYLSSDREGGQGSDDIYSFSYKPTLETPAPTPVIVATPTPSASTQGNGAEPDDLIGIVYYDLDKHDIRSDAVTELDRIVEVLKAHPNIKIKLTAYTDARASVGYNITLSKQRAEAAQAYLLSKGIDAGRLRILWRGEENLVNNCPDDVPCPEKAQQLNRRTEIRVDR